MRRALLAATASLTLLIVMASSPATASGRGCRAFGQNVASLAQSLGPQFGANASGAATSGPGAFVDLVVRPEQERLCTTGR